MAKRLLTLRQIQAEKYPRGRSTIYAEIAAGHFPKPIGGCVPNLWEEDVVDLFVEKFDAAAKERQAEGQRRVAKAAATRADHRAAELLGLPTPTTTPGMRRNALVGLAMTPKVIRRSRE